MIELRILLVAVSTMAVAAACGQGDSVGAGPLSDQDRAAIESAVGEFVRAANTGDWETLAGLYHEDAAILPPDTMVVRGRGPIRDFFSGLFTAVPVENFSTETVEIEGRSGLAYTRGSFTLRFLPDGADSVVAMQGKDILVWERQPGGEWVIIRDIWNWDG